MKTIKTICVVWQLSVLALLLFLLPPASVQAQFTFTTNNDALTITGYTGPGGEVIIPSATNGLPVTGIAAYAFSHGGLTRIVIPDSVTFIQTWAFFRCTSLTNITIPHSVTNIGEMAFENCTSLTEITVEALNSAYSSVDGVLFDKGTNTLIQFPEGKTANYTVPNGVNVIGSRALQYCVGLTSVTIPDSVTTISYRAFAACTGLTNITIGNSATTFDSRAFVSCTNVTRATFDMTVIPNVFSALHHLEILVLGDQVKRVSDSVFYKFTNLTSIVFGNSVTNIGSSAFWSCTRLTSITIPDSVISIGSHAFWSCTNLTNVTIGNSVTNIGDSAFRGCTGLTNITIPNSVTSLGGSAFLDCSSLTSATIDMTSIAPNFSGGSGMFRLTILIIGEHVKTIGSEAFYSRPSLTSVSIGNSVTNIGDSAFRGCTGLNNVTIGNSVATIGILAFQGCTGLTSITIPGSVVNIGNFAFAGCTHLSKVYFRSNAPGANSNVFDGDNQATIYCLPGTTGWGTTFGGRPTALWLPQALTGDAGFGVQTNQFGFNIGWASGMAVAVDACTDLANPLWTSLQTNTLTSDTLYFSDPQWTNSPARFYRLRWP